MKKLISVLLAALMLLSSVTVVMAEDAVEYELPITATPESYGLFGTAFPAVDGLGNYSWTSPKLYLPKSDLAVGDEGYGCFILRKPNESDPAQFDPITFAEVIEGDNIYDYQLQINLQRVAGTIYVADLEIGLGNYAAENKDADTCTDKPSVVKTVYVGNVMSGMANGANQTVTVDVADILANGNEQMFAVEGVEPNELDADNLNLVAIKATCNTATVNANFLQINSIKLVKKSDAANIPTVVDFKGAAGASGFPGSEAPASTDSSYRVLVGQGSYKFSPKTGTVVGDTLYGHQSARKDSNTPFLVNNLFGDAKMEDYVLELGIKKLTSANYIENIEFGLACCNGASGYASLPVSLKTVNANFDETYKTMAKDTVETVTIPVKDILGKGNFKNIEKSGILDTTFAVENITGIAMKATATADVASTLGVVSLDSIKFIRKTSDITYDEEAGTVDFSACDYTTETPSLTANQAIVAYYNDYEGNGVYTLSYCDVLPLTAVDANNAALSLPLDGTWGGAEKIKAFLFNSMGEMTPLTKAEVIR